MMDQSGRSDCFELRLTVKQKCALILKISELRPQRDETLRYWPGATQVLQWFRWT